MIYSSYLRAHRTTSVKAVSVAIALLALAARTLSATQDAAAYPDETILYVAECGNDSNDGSAEHPLATVGKAAEKAKGVRASVIKVAPGLYAFGETLTLTKEHSGLRFEALDTATPPVFSAGCRLGGWTITSKGWWKLNVSGKKRFSHFYVNNTRRLRPYLPRDGYFNVGAKFGAPPGIKPTRFYACEGDLPDNLDNIGKIEFCVFHYWSMSRVPLKSYDPQSRLVTLAGGISRPANSDLTEDYWYRLDNVRNELGSRRGEWYLDDDGTLTYIPEEGELPGNTLAIAAQLERLIDIDGACAITFKNIEFAHTGWNMPEAGYAAAQAVNGQGAWAICVKRSEDIVFDACVFRHLGGGGIELGAASKNCTVENSEFFDIGSGAIHVGPGRESGKPIDSSLDFAAVKREDYACNTTISNCLLTAGGRVQAGAVGIWVTHAPCTKIIACTIRDFFYSGISVGWNWAFGPNSTWGNLIADNEIGPVGQGVLSDLGGIYTLGAQEGTVLRGNYIHDVTASRYGGYSIYFDSGSSFITASNNIVRAGEVGWFLARLSASNRVENNVFVNATRYPICPLYRRTESSPSRFANNILCWKDGSLMPEAHGPDTIAFESNLIWRTSGRLPGAPAGFSESESAKNMIRRRIRASTAGCSLTPRTAALPAPPRVFPPAPPIVQKPLSENFESLENSSRWNGWQYHPETAGGTSCRVTSETAASGQKSFCIIDDRDSYGPWLEYTIRRDTGKLAIDFDLFIENDARPHFECRDSDAICLARGPFLAVDEQGRFRAANGAVLGAVPYGKWISVRLECALAKGSSKTYTVRISVPGEQSPRIHEKLWMHPQFNSLSWMGFLALAKDGKRYFIDNFKISPPASNASGKRKESAK